eukprot:3370911-Prymnesium_polylepis.2
MGRPEIRGVVLVLVCGGGVRSCVLGAERRVGECLSLRLQACAATQKGEQGARGLPVCEGPLPLWVKGLPVCEGPLPLWVKGLPLAGRFACLLAPRHRVLDRLLHRRLVALRVHPPLGLAHALPRLARLRHRAALRLRRRLLTTRARMCTRVHVRRARRSQALLQ